MRKLPSWLRELLPRRNQSFAGRFVAVLATWGLPMIVWEVISSGVYRSPTAWPVFLLLEVPSTLLGVLVFAALEHAYFHSSPKRSDNQSS